MTAKLPLPPCCEICIRTGGLWVTDDQGDVGRCSCERGRALAMGLPKWRKQRKREAAHAARIAAMHDGKAEAGRTFA